VKRILFTLILLMSLLHIMADTAFADSLYANGEYYRAITEYYRGIFSGEDRDYCHSRIRLSFLKGEDYSGLVDYLDTNTNPDDRAYRSYAWIKQGRADIASHVSSGTADSISRSWYAISEAYRGDYGEAAEIARSLPEEQREPLSELVMGADSLSYRSPALAAGLGIIPGLGYAYTGSWQTAISAFLTNIIIGAVTFELLDSKLEVAAIGSGLAGLGFYLGSINGSAQDAVKRNRRLRTKYLDQALEPLLPSLLKGL